MTNKLPVVGKRYRKIGEGYEIVVEKIRWNLVYFRLFGETSCPLKHFWEDFEELPEDKAETECSVGKKSNCKRCEKEFSQHHKSDYYCSNYCKNMIAIKAEAEIKPETKSHISELSPEVKGNLFGGEMNKGIERPERPILKLLSELPEKSGQYVFGIKGGKSLLGYFDHESKTITIPRDDNFDKAFEGFCSLGDVVDYHRKSVDFHDKLKEQEGK